MKGKYSDVNEGALLDSLKDSSRKSGWSEELSSKAKGAMRNAGRWREWGKRAKVATVGAVLAGGLFFGGLVKYGLPYITKLKNDKVETFNYLDQEMSRTGFLVDGGLETELYSNGEKVDTLRGSPGEKIGLSMKGSLDRRVFGKCSFEGDFHPFIEKSQHYNFNSGPLVVKCKSNLEKIGSLEEVNLELPKQEGVYRVKITRRLNLGDDPQFKFDKYKRWVSLERMGIDYQLFPLIVGNPSVKIFVDKHATRTALDLGYGNVYNVVDYTLHNLGESSAKDFDVIMRRHYFENGKSVWKTDHVKRIEEILAGESKRVRFIDKAHRPGDLILIQKGNKIVSIANTNTNSYTRNFDLMKNTKGFSDQEIKFVIGAIGFSSLLGRQK